MNEQVLNKNINTYEEESFILEECFYCGKELTKTKDIFIAIEKDRYVCKPCGQKHRLHIVPCADLD